MIERMFDTLETGLKPSSPRELIERIREAEVEISRQRARQVRLLRELQRHYFSAPSPSAAELAAKLDVSADTTKTLLETATRTPEDSDRMAKLESGEWTFDRAAALARLFGEGADDQTMQKAAGRDIAGIQKLRALTRRIRRRDERQAHEERHVRSWTSLDESAGFIHAQLGGYDWQVVNRALDERADQFPREARNWSRQQLRADALVAIAQDWLDGRVSPGGTSSPIVTVLVDGADAAHTGCEAGVSLTASCAMERSR